MKLEKKIIHLALQGGGAHGAFTWGVLDKLLEDGRVSIDGLCATSAGSMNAIVYAYGKMKGGTDGAREALHTFWKKVSTSNILSNFQTNTSLDAAIKKMKYTMLDSISHFVSPYQFNPLNYNVLKEILLSIVDFEEMKKCICSNLFITATNVRTGKVRIFDNKELSIEVILASACLPYLFQAVKVGDEYYWDGGYSGNPAIFPLFYHGTTKDVVIVHINPMVRYKLPMSAAEIMNRINEITFNSSLLKELRAVAFVNKLLEQGWVKDEFKDQLHHIFIHSIRADRALEGFDATTKFDTDWQFIHRLYELGRIEAKNWLNSNFDNIGIRSSVDLKKEFLKIDENEDIV
jgi:NTE family protein